MDHSTKTNQWIDGYKLLMKQRHEQSRETYFLNFMFRQMNLSHDKTLRIMGKAVVDFYNSGLTRFSRQPHNYSDRLPAFIGMPDLPVFKKNKKCIPHHVNGGLHFNGLLFVPDNCRVAFGRMVETLQLIFERSKAVIGNLIERIHPTLVTEDIETMADYTFKLGKSRPEMRDEVLILPAHR
jgi:hypothetical protein